MDDNSKLIAIDIIDAEYAMDSYIKIIGMKLNEKFSLKSFVINF